MRKLFIPLLALVALAAAGCATTGDVRLAAPVNDKVRAACKADPQGCVVLPLGAIKGALDEAFEMGRFIGAMGR